ncbi:hypothetical protein ATCV1_z418L [Acanthocystis turfacea chlorella virus 1]|uniref:Uncharacterized protein z418L n=1 Tax=Chlorovirus heliozoae TaxID=322019 RepID=A7K928_9PHYC|nr:hypothetical protein ATCV1_z418L [Acanthocystis turfacea chlorella virus 1]ABT16552.1 hypothetical protein ATCV1_z418L [Acanthocystis turfacea chlorella virus 1]
MGFTLHSRQSCYWRQPRNYQGLFQSTVPLGKRLYSLCLVKRLLGEKMHFYNQGELLVRFYGVPIYCFSYDHWNHTRPSCGVAEQPEPHYVL